MPHSLSCMLLDLPLNQVSTSYSFSSLASSLHVKQLCSEPIFQTLTTFSELFSGCIAEYRFYFLQFSLTLFLWSESIIGSHSTARRNLSCIKQILFSFNWNHFQAKALVLLEGVRTFPDKLLLEWTRPIIFYKIVPASLFSAIQSCQWFWNATMLSRCNSKVAINRVFGKLKKHHSGNNGCYSFYWMPYITKRRLHTMFHTSSVCIVTGFWSNVNPIDLKSF